MDIFDSDMGVFFGFIRRLKIMSFKIGEIVRIKSGTIITDFNNDPFLVRIDKDAYISGNTPVRFHKPVLIGVFDQRLKNVFGNQLLLDFLINLKIDSHLLVIAIIHNQQILL